MCMQINLWLQVTSPKDHWSERSRVRMVILSTLTLTIKSFAKSRSKMKVSDVWGNLVPDTWTADWEGALPELGPRPHNKSCYALIVEERSWRRPDSAELNCTMLLRYTGPNPNPNTNPIPNAGLTLTKTV